MGIDTAQADSEERARVHKWKIVGPGLVAVVLGGYQLVTTIQKTLGG